VKYALSIACGASSVWEKMAHGDTIGPPNPSFLAPPQFRGTGPTLGDQKSLKEKCQESRRVECQSKARVMSSQWCTIESDPGVFTELIEELGVKDVAVSEIYSFDAVQEWQRDGCYGFIYLFQWKKEEDPRATIEEPEGMFFARQIVQDACATQALLSVLLNAEIDRGEMLEDFREFSTMLDSESRGISIGSHDRIRAVHNSFARPEPFVQDEENKPKKGKSQEIFHFVAYIPFNGQVYEIDGLRPGPIHIGAASRETWWDVARPAIEDRMQRANDIKSVLLAVGRSQKASLEEKLELLQAQAMSFTGVESAESLAVQGEVRQAERDLADNAEERASQRAENVLRRHNFFPLILQLSQALAKRGQLVPMVAAAKEKKARAVAARAGAGVKAGGEAAGEGK